MEIFHVFGIHWKLLAAQMVNFSIALFVLHRYVYKPIFAILAERQAKLAQGLEDAELARATKERGEEESRELLRQAREEGGKLVETLHKQGIEEERNIIRTANEKSTSLLEEARVRAEAERVHLLRESEKELAKMAVLAAEKILRASPAKN
jgi:F-type H+-transporting ATPase subunit b